jgi:basic amino acid/polyamine antiporter, APA family
MANPTSLQRQVGVWGATMMGLGSIIGTGIFVSVGIAAAVTGPSVVLAIAVAAVVAVCNGLSSAQLAARHPVSGGTYEYGYRWLHPTLGFTAGWMFLCAKSASAATAALGFAGYVLSLLAPQAVAAQVPLGLGLVVVLTGLVLSGLRRSSNSNAAVVSVTLLCLLLFVMAGIPTLVGSGGERLLPFFAPAEGLSPTAGFLQACALMFVAYTGYGRIATLAEEVRQPRRTIPRAVIVTLGVSMLLYMAVGLVAVSVAGGELSGSVGVSRAAPLEVAARRLPVPGLAMVVAVGAVTAMVGVVLNLILGLSRVLLAMGRRRDVPALFGRLSGASATPTAAVLAVALLIATLVLIGNIRLTWSFSAFTVLVYYAITNLAALRMKPDERLYHPAIPTLGLMSCLFLAFWVDPAVWLAGLGLIAAGLVWHSVARRVCSAATRINDS